MHARKVVPIDSARPGDVPGSYGEQFGDAGQTVHFVHSPSLLWGLGTTTRRLLVSPIVVTFASHLSDDDSRLLTAMA